MSAHDPTHYPHEGGCPDCYAARVCNVCGASTAQDLRRCTNGRCGACHGRHCTPGGDVGPGHGFGKIGRVSPVEKKSTA